LAADTGQEPVFPVWDQWDKYFWTDGVGYAPAANL
jgi:hypothetical protein